MSALLCRQCSLRLRPLIRQSGYRSLSLSSAHCAPQWWVSGVEWMSQSTSTKLLQDGLVALHETAHLPWWAAIAVGTVGLRLATAPLAIWAERLIGRRTLMEFAVHTSVAKDMLSRPNAPQYGEQKVQLAIMTKVQRHTMLIARQKGLQLSRIMMMKIAPTFLWLSSSFALRNLAYGGDITAASMATGGCLWFPNLLASDPLLILPLINFTVFLLLSRVNRVHYPAELRYTKSHILYKTRQYLFVGIGLAVIPIASVLPACLPYFWFLLSTTSLIQGLLLQHPRVKKVLGIHPLPSDTSTPFRQLFRSPINRSAKDFQKSSSHLQ
uniref:Uncharacterized protein n=1 Tax=Plectus sambesii TaxID=2011161 RepID=A0A914WZ44_9BILA